jgi:agmatine deiminase
VNQIPAVYSNLVVDGGNVVKWHDAAIMCDKVFCENPTIGSKDLIRQLKSELGVPRLYFIPVQTEDIFGHANGLIRFYNDETVLINAHKGEKGFKRKLFMALDNAGLDYIEIPYNVCTNLRPLEANGTYINYLHIGRNIILPEFDLPEDKIAFRLFEELYPGHNISAINCNDIASAGGVLNCISWNVLK